MSSHKHFLLLILIIFALLLTAMFTNNGAIAWMTIPCLLVIGIALILTPLKENLDLQVTRTVEKEINEKGTYLKVALSVQNRGKPISRLTLLDSLPKETKLIQGKLQQSMALASGETATYHYTLIAHRGVFCWENIQARLSDPLGIIETQLELEACAEIQVQPELKKFRPFNLKPQSTLHSAGSIPAHSGGRGTHFWGVREYHPGDPLRQLDWRLTARHPHQFFTKEFEQEEIADIGLVLDARQSTDIKSEGDSIFEHSIEAAASLAEVFLRQGNRLSLLVYEEPVKFLYPGYGKVQLNRVMHTLAQASSAAASSPASFIYLPKEIFSSHSLLIFISPLAPYDHKLFPSLRASGHQVLLVSPNPIPYTRRLVKNRPIDRLAIHLTEIDHLLEMKKISQLWIPVIDWQVNQPLAPLVQNALSHVHIQRQN